MGKRPKNLLEYGKWLFVRGLTAVTVSLLIVIGLIAWRAYKVANLDNLITSAECSTNTAELGGPWGQVQLSIEVADTDETRARGLMFREQLPPNNGMLFVYPEPTAPIFWMKDTPLPLDILFFDERGDLRHVHFNARPFDETPISGGTGIRFVMELQAGEFQRLGIGLRAALRHPTVEHSSARWAC